MSGCADMRISFAAMARATGVPGGMARRICKKVLQGDGQGRRHSYFEFVLLTISLMLTFVWGLTTRRARPGGITRYRFARAGGRLLKPLADAPELSNPGCDNLSARLEAPKKQRRERMCRGRHIWQVDAGR